jgi:hypothetical protein
LALSKQHGWQLEAWAVLANHYHFVARGNTQSTNLRQFLQQLHYDSARGLSHATGNRNRTARSVWSAAHSVAVGGSAPSKARGCGTFQALRDTAGVFAIRALGIANAPDWIRGDW